MEDTLLLILLLLLTSIKVLPSDGIKIDCFPIANASKEKCEILNCTWHPVDETQKNEPWCFMPQNRISYSFESDQNQVLLLEQASALPDDIKRVSINVEYIGQDIVRIKLFDANNNRFEPELPVLQIPKSSSIQDKKLTVTINKSRLIVSRHNPTPGNHSVLFDTDLSKLIFSNQFIQLNSRLSSEYVFGLGEHYDDFAKKADKYKIYSFFNTDKLPLPNGQRSYGSFPFYLSFDANSSAHAVYLRNSNAMDIILSPDPSITFRPVGGILDFFIFAGPTPLDAIKQYQALVGLPTLPPLWSLGFHLSRYNYLSDEETRRVWKATRDASIPFDTQWNDIDYMDRHNDFTYDKKSFGKLPQLIDDIHNASMRYVLLFDPGVSQEENYEPYTLGIKMDIFVKDSTNQTLIGKVWNDSGRTVFPDFTNERTIDYWTKLFKDFHSQIHFDGAWIDMNEVSNFVDGSLSGCPTNNKLDSPPYSPGSYQLNTKTFCMSAKYKKGYEYDLHNLYSHYEAIATKAALKAIKPNDRQFILSRATSIGQGKYSGHWSGDVLSTWDYLRWSIPSLIEHSMYGFSIMGADICGFVGNTSEDLCARWSTLGSFYSFARNHNENNARAQDPVSLGPVVISANKNAFKFRYSILPYLYTLQHLAHRQGLPYARSLVLEFPGERNILIGVEDEFLVGDSILVAPIVYPNATSRKVTLPSGKWYQSDINPISEYYSLPKMIDIPLKDKCNVINVDDITLEGLPIFYRGGKVIYRYKKRIFTTQDMAKDYVDIDIYLDERGLASGFMYTDDGITDNDEIFSLVTTSVTSDKILFEIESHKFINEITIGSVNIFGYKLVSTNGYKLEVKLNQGNYTTSHSLPAQYGEGHLRFELSSFKVSESSPLVINL